MSNHFLEIWHGEILTDVATETSYWNLLDDQEKIKAKAFTRTKLQQKYVFVRGKLRIILASYLRVEPKNIKIKVNAYGKPYLVDQNLNFNLAHTDCQYVVAVSNHDNVGIDLEYPRAKINMSEIVTGFFSETEQLYWHRLSGQQQHILFFKIWVRKEAFVKAVGRGIALGLNLCVVDCENHSQFLKIPNEYGLASDWTIREIIISRNDYCAVVTKRINFNYKQTELK